ncbi:protease 3 precursor [bacterium BMS3Bbin01]|nr:protease 3 precursor [bacterium BMS3Bbin01]
MSFLGDDLCLPHSDHDLAGDRPNEPPCLRGDRPEPVARLDIDECEGLGRLLCDGRSRHKQPGAGSGLLEEMADTPSGKYPEAVGVARDRTVVHGSMVAHVGTRLQSEMFAGRHSAVACPGMTSSLRLSFPLERLKLDNGLRIVLIPDRSSSVVAVSVLYDVGFRSEPEGRSGFAHLFEHMMFQGSEQVPKGEFDRLLMGNGGVVNGTTAPDFTAYFEILPAAALEMALFLEADRMRSLQVDQENLDNQTAVVQEEIRLNVLNRAYGRFPWILLPALMFDTYPNAHDGYGSFEDLEAARLEDVRDFFARFYTPANAVLTVCGDLQPDAAVRLIERHFAGIEGRRRPRLRSFTEPIRDEVRRSRYRDVFAPAPALALGYRVPDPIAHLDQILALDVLARVLAGGAASRLEQRLVHKEGLVTSVDAWIGEGQGWAGPFEMRDPTRFQVSAFYPRASDRSRIIEAIDEEIEAVTGGLEPGEVDRVVSRVTAEYARKMNHMLNRSLGAAQFELLYDEPGLLDAIPALYANVTARAVSEAARVWLRADRRAELDIVPGGGQ